MTDEWVVFRRVNGERFLGYEPIQRWYEFEIAKPHAAKNYVMLARGLTYEQAKAMVKLARGEDD